MKNSEIIIETDRLILRQWKKSDLKPFAVMNADPLVREYFSTSLTEEESNAHAKKFSEHIEKYGWGFFATELKNTKEFIGMIGLQHVYFEGPFTKDKPTVEIGWRLAFEYWNKGFATEGALACLDYALNQILLNEIVAFTTIKNQRSRKVMEKIGMKYAQEFDHPNVPDGHTLKRHVLYKIEK